eukprot:gene3853-4110_t
MLHLHKNQVLHSDLKVRNVLLKSDASGRGCIAKVADFGLAVRMDCMDTHVSAFQGTMSHMAPEALLHGRISKAADVYSYGITLWELFTGGQAYQGIARALVGHQVAVLGLRPTLPPFTPADYRSLTEECWHQDADKRPSFDVVLTKLLAMRQSLGQAQTQPLQRYKLQSKGTFNAAGMPEKRNSSETKLAEAEAHGLVQLGSYYVNMSSASTLHGSLLQQEDCPGFTGSGQSCSAGRADRGQAEGSRLGSGGPPAVGFVAKSGRSFFGTELEPITDTEVEELGESEHTKAVGVASGWSWVKAV